MEPCCPLPLNPPDRGHCATSAADPLQHFSPLSFRKDFTVLSHGAPMNMCPVVGAGTHPRPPAPPPSLFLPHRPKPGFFSRGFSQIGLVCFHPFDDPWIPKGAFKLRLCGHAETSLFLHSEITITALFTQQAGTLARPLQPCCSH